ncbi:cotranscriptional regulator ARB2A isoform X3 [Rattus norvegicus]|uniref:cotranscriptional regulator ARB2A isoform X3 n=1 Tax=Rattus norvegicus TaxID=10116 RepID=UPI0019170A28|nr:cotranscriptional regulator FAM172A isoform X5 [Rattus norvegicus]
MSISLSSLIFLPIWINMAQIQQGGPNEKEKTTPLKDLLSRIDLNELMKKDEPPFDFPDTLEGFEYAFNEKGQLRHIKTGEPFVFNYREDLHRWNQKRYEALGEIITRYVYELLESDCNLKKISIPVDATESEPKSFIFMSEDALTNPQKLMVLIHGSGVVRAGQWARRLIINEDLDSGTQIPFIKRAVDEGYGVIVLNPNENYIEVEKQKMHKQSSSDGTDEPAGKRERKDKVSKETKKRRDFYEKYRNPQKEKEMMQLFIRMIQREADVKSKVTAVALTDSVHNVWHQEAGKSIREWMRENCCNWVSSSEPLDTSVESMLPDCPRVSAESTSTYITCPTREHEDILDHRLQTVKSENRREQKRRHRPSRAHFVEELPVHLQVLRGSLRSQEQLAEADPDAALAPDQARGAVSAQPPAAPARCPQPPGPH